MDDKELDKLLDDAAANWRVPVDPPLDGIWSAVAAEAFRHPASRPAPGWGVVGIAAAAALVVGVLGGGYLVRRGLFPPVTDSATAVSAVVASAPAVSGPNQRAMGELIGRTAVLLAALPGDTTARFGVQLSGEAAHLLTTTRMLLDSPIASDPRLRNLLQDLELVLAQVARLEPQHRRNEIQFIQTALDEHDIVPRLRSAAADFSLNDF